MLSGIIVHAKSDVVVCGTGYVGVETAGGACVARMHPAVHASTIHASTESACKAVSALVHGPVQRPRLWRLVCLCLCACMERSPFQNLWSKLTAASTAAAVKAAATAWLIPDTTSCFWALHTTAMALGARLWDSRATGSIAAGILGGQQGTAGGLEVGLHAGSRQAVARAPANNSEMTVFCVSQNPAAELVGFHPCHYSLNPVFAPGAGAHGGRAGAVQGGHCGDGFKSV